MRSIIPDQSLILPQINKMYIQKLPLFQTSFPHNIFTLIGIIVVVVTIILIYKWPFGKNMQKTLAHIEEELPHGQRIILVKNFSENELRNAINAFINQYKEDRPVLSPPQVRTLENNFLLLFETTLDYRDFCFWVNYLIYSDKNKRHNNDITGWYEVGVTSNQHPLANKVLMLFIPESDEEFDNVYIADSLGNCYKQEFAWDEKIVPIDNLTIRYQEIPSLE